MKCFSLDDMFAELIKCGISKSFEYKLDFEEEYSISLWPIAMVLRL